MRAAQITTLSGPDAIEVCEVPAPSVAPGQILIDVHVAGVNFPDLLMTTGDYQFKPELPFTPGSEVAGLVAQADPDTGFRVGDRVAAFAMLNGLAEQVVTNAEYALRLPESITFAQGAALPMNYLTCEFALCRRAGLQAGESVLVQGAAGGIGTAAIQIARAMGATVIAVASTEDKRNIALAAGAHHAVAVDGFRAAVQELTNGRGVDVVVDPVGGDRFTDSLRVLSPEGRLLVIGFTEGNIPTVKVNRLLLNNVDVRGVGWGAFAFARPGFIGQQWAHLRELMDTGAISPVVGSTHPLTESGAAIAELRDRRALGKVVVSLR